MLCEAESEAPRSGPPTSVYGAAGWQGFERDADATSVAVQQSIEAMVFRGADSAAKQQAADPQHSADVYAHSLRWGIT
jgi:hypothetical protein